MTCGRCRMECSKKNILFSNVAAWRLFSPQIAQCSKRNACWDIFYVVFIWLSLLYFAIMFLLQHIRPASLYVTDGDGKKYLIYLTNWTYVSFLVSLSLRAILATYYVLFPHTPRNPNQPLEKPFRDADKVNHKDSEDRIQKKAEADGHDKNRDQDIEGNENTNNGQDEQLANQGNYSTVKKDDRENSESKINERTANEESAVIEKPKRYLLVSPVPWYLIINWILYELTATGNSVVTLLFWTLLYSKGDKLKFHTTTTHGINMLFVVIDIFITAMPIRFLHIWIPMVYAVAYVIFSVIYELTGGTNTQGDPHIYGVIDWSDKPGLAIVYSIGSLILTAVLHIVLFGLYELKIHLYSFICRHIRSHQQPHYSNDAEAGSVSAKMRKDQISIIEPPLTKPVSLPTVVRTENINLRSVREHPTAALVDTEPHQPDKSRAATIKPIAQLEPKVVINSVKPKMLKDQRSIIEPQSTKPVAPSNVVRTEETNVPRYVEEIVKRARESLTSARVDIEPRTPNQSSGPVVKTATQSKPKVGIDSENKLKKRPLIKSLSEMLVDILYDKTLDDAPPPASLLAQDPQELNNEPVVLADTPSNSGGKWKAIMVRRKRRRKRKRKTNT